MMENSSQTVIGAVATVKEFEKFLKSSDTYVILMELHLSLLENLIQSAHQCGKKVLLHLDLIKGISSDESGCEYACQVLQADGVISTKGRVIETAKRNKKITILRLFLIDTKSLEKGITLCNSLEPDYVEVLPGIAYSILPYIKERTSAKIMSGGLIKTREQMEACFLAGAEAVTISGIYQT